MCSLSLRRMGYTHYWYKPAELPQDKWDAFLDSVKKIVEEGSAILCFEYDQPDVKPKLGKDIVRFNGRDDDGHETFYFARKQESGGMPPNDRGLYFNCCKTARKPYDYYVVEVLKLAKQCFGDDIVLKSDGDVFSDESDDDDVE